MRFQAAILSISLGVLTIAASSAAPKKTGFTVPVIYEGGTVPMNPGKIKATVDEDRVVARHGHLTADAPVGPLMSDVEGAGGS